MKLYEISEALRTVIDGGLVFDEETGEVLFDSKNLDELEAARDEKLEACAIVKKELDFEAESLRMEEKRLAERRRRKEAEASRLAEYIARNAPESGLETPKASLSWRKSSQVVITDESAIPGDFLTYTPKVDKTAIRKAIKESGSCPGAELVTKRNLVIK